MTKRSYALASLLLGTTNLSLINPMEANTGLIARPKKVSHDFLKIISDANWDSEQGHEINREAP